jgi:hypothetical protein
MAGWLGWVAYTVIALCLARLLIHLLGADDRLMRGRGPTVNEFLRRDRASAEANKKTPLSR